MALNRILLFLQGDSLFALFRGRNADVGKILFFHLIGRIVIVFMWGIDLYLILTASQRLVKRDFLFSFLPFANPKNECAVGVQEFLHFDSFCIGKLGVEFA